MLYRASLIAQLVKNLPAVRETRVQITDMPVWSEGEVWVEGIILEVITM